VNRLQQFCEKSGNSPNERLFDFEPIRWRLFELRVCDWGGAGFILGGMSTN
jgi:hypothetical protein